MAFNIFEMYGKIGAKDEASSVIDSVTQKAKSANHTLSNGLAAIGDKASAAGSALTSKITKPAIGAATALGGITLAKGFARLTGIDDARAKLTGLGHDAEAVEKIMNSALESVKGTSFGMDEAATTAANAVAAGIEPGEKLTKYLKTTADAAAIAGVSMAEMGSIVNKVQTGQKAYTENLEQLSDRGIPIYQWLAKEANVAAGEVKDLASKGEISSEMFMAAIEKNIGGAAAIMGDMSFTASLKNMWAAVGRIGANFLDAGGKGGGFFSQMKPLIGSTTDMLGGLEEKAASFGEKFGQSFSDAIKFVTDLKAQFDELSPEMQGTVLHAVKMGAAIAVGLGPALKISGKVISALAPVARGLETASHVAGAFADSFKLVPGKATDSMGKAKNSITDFVNSSKKSIGDFTDALSNIGGGSFDFVKNLIPDAALNKVSDFGNRLKNIPVSGLQKVGDKVGEVAFKFDTWAGRFDNSGIYGKIDGLKNKLGSLTPAIGRVGSGAQSMLSQGTGAVTGIVGKTTSALTSVLGIALKMLGPGAIIAGLLAGLGLLQAGFGDQINQMIMLAITKGPELVTNFTNSIVSALPGLIAQGTQLVASVALLFQQMFPVVLQAGIDIITNLVSGLSQNLPSLISSAITIIQTLLQGLISAAPQLLMAGLQLLQGLIDGIVQNLPQLISAATQIISNLSVQLSIMLPQIIESGIQILLSLINGIVTAIPQLLPIVIQLISIIANAVLTNLPQIIKGGIQILQALISGVVQILPELIPMVAQIFAQLIKLIGEHLPEILEQGIRLLGELAAGIIQAIPDLLKKLPEVFEGIKSAFSDVDWGAVGSDIIEGIASGITGAAKSLANAAANAADNALDWVKEKLDINSPSRVFRDEVGKMIPAGIAVGIDSEADQMQNSLDKAANSLAFDPDLNASLVDPSTVKIASEGILNRGTNSNDQTVQLLRAMLDVLRAILEKDPNILLDGDLVSYKLRDRIRAYVEEANALDQALGMNFR